MVATRAIGCLISQKNFNYDNPDDFIITTALMPKIIAVHSFRHGTGKSSLTANLAVAIAREGYRVGAIDADIELAIPSNLPGIYSYFGLQKSHYLGDYIQGRATIAEIGQEVKKEHFSGIIDEKITGKIYLFARDLSRQGQAHYPEFSDLKILSTLLDQITANFNLNYLLIDLYPGLNETTLSLLALCDTLCLVLGLERADFQGTAVILDVAKQLDIPQTCLLVNRVPTDIDRLWLKKQVSLAYDTAIVDTLPQIETMLPHQHKQNIAANIFANIFSLCDRNSPSASEFQQLVKRMMEENIPQNAPRQEHETTMGLSLLDLLDLPESERTLFHSVLRRRSITFEQILQQTHLEPEIAHSILADLLAKGLLKQVEDQGTIYYRPYLTPKQGRKLNAQIWDVLTEEENH
ncbi:MULTISPECIES: MinD/ParA family protein [Spirulina sp. CCY15215]|uniref:MinD/ParA family ATP-binding protein n=1 Tax=Spirulina sp. CCY15215 TaxID=2767591 RepID=UPI00194F6644|nr:MinD/ParA family protein [Spirulina major]